MIELAKQFVPCTDEVYRLEMGKEPDCRFFQSLANQGHYSDPKQLSKQGTYVCSADGTFLGSINSRDPDNVIRVLKAGLEKFKQLPEAKKTTAGVAEAPSVERWESKLPSDGLALAVYSRDLPDDLSPASDKQIKWNRDSSWFTKTEIATAMRKDLKEGDKFSLPSTLGIRLLRYNLVDTIKGQTDEFQPAEVKPEITCTVTNVSDKKIEFDFSGATTADSVSTRNRRTPRGVVTQLKGSATFDRTEERFKKFDFVAIGYRWGRTQYNGRHRQANLSPIGFAGSIAPSDEPPNVPGLFYAYDADWVVNN